MFGWGILHVFLMSLVTYLIMNNTPRNEQHKYVMIWVLGYLSYQHIDRMINNFGGYDLDISTYTMLLVCKLSAMAFCYKDGAERVEKLNED